MFNDRIKRIISRQNISAVIRFTKDGRPYKKHENPTVELYRNIKDRVSNTIICLFYGCRLVIKKTLQILHIGFFGMQRMKQLARSVVYWPDVDARILEISLFAYFALNIKIYLLKYLYIHGWYLKNHGV